jgi:GTPase SAR1 family protein
MYGVTICVNHLISGIAYNSYDGYLLAYSITDHDSLQTLERWVETMSRVGSKQMPPVVVVATKCDLEYERQVLPSGELPSCSSS